MQHPSTPRLFIPISPGLDGNASEEFGAAFGLDFVEPDRDAISSLDGAARSLSAWLWLP
jgi:hypothetical protein